MNEKKTNDFDRASESLKEAKRAMLGADRDSAQTSLDESIAQYPTRDALILRLANFLLAGQADNAWRDYQRLMDFQRKDEDPPVEVSSKTFIGRPSRSWSSRLLPILAAAALLAGTIVFLAARYSNASKQLAMSQEENIEVQNELEESLSRYRLATGVDVVNNDPEAGLIDDENSEMPAWGMLTAAVFISKLDPRAPEFFQPTGMASVKIENLYLRSTSSGSWMKMFMNWIIWEAVNARSMNYQLETRSIFLCVPVSPITGLSPIV